MNGGLTPRRLKSLTATCSACFALCGPDGCQVPHSARGSCGEALCLTGLGYHSLSWWLYGVQARQDWVHRAAMQCVVLSSRNVVTPSLQSSILLSRICVCSPFRNCEEAYIGFWHTHIGMWASQRVNGQHAALVAVESNKQSDFQFSRVEVCECQAITQPLPLRQHPKPMGILLCQSFSAFLPLRL